MGDVDEQTIIRPEEAALVVEESGEFRLVMPEFGDDEDVPPGVLLLAAISIKLDDDEWLDMTMSALEDAH